jgi:hypothetical protein
MMHRSPARLVVPVLLVLAAAMGGPARAQSLLGLSIGAPASGRQAPGPGGRRLGGERPSWWSAATSCRAAGRSR